MTDQAQQVHVAHSFAVDKERLYKAWTEEAQLKQWWKPMEHRLVKVENDLQPGGKVAYHFDNDINIHGQYKDVKPAEKLVYTWIWDLPDGSEHKGEYLLTVLFKGEGDRSELEVTQSDFRSEHAVKPHQEGWEKALADLQAYLEGNR